MQKQKTRSYRGKPTLKQIHSALTKTPAQIRAQIGQTIGVTESIVFAIIRGDRVCSPSERSAIANIYGKRVSEISWTEKESIHN